MNVKSTEPREKQSNSHQHLVFYHKRPYRRPFNNIKSQGGIMNQSRELPFKGKVNSYDYVIGIYDNRKL